MYKMKEAGSDHGVLRSQVVGKVSVNSWCVLPETMCVLPLNTEKAQQP